MKYNFTIKTKHNCTVLQLTVNIISYLSTEEATARAAVVVTQPSPVGVTKEHEGNLSTHTEKSTKQQCFKLLIYVHFSIKSY